MPSHEKINGHKNVIFSKARAINFRNRKQIQVSFIIRGTKHGLHTFMDCDPDNKLMNQFLKNPLPNHLDKTEHCKLADFINSHYVEASFVVEAKYNPKSKFNDIVSIEARTDLPCFVEHLKESL